MSENIEQPKKKRGRPRKVPASNEEYEVLLNKEEKLLQVHKIKDFSSADTLNQNLALMDQGQKFNKKVGRPLKYSDDELVRQQVANYFTYCGDNECLPSFLGLALFLGVDRSTLYEYVNGDYSFSPTIRLARTLIHKTVEDSALNGKINPVLYIFISKNYFNMVDKVEPMRRKPESGLPSEEEQMRILIANVPPFME